MRSTGSSSNTGAGCRRCRRSTTWSRRIVGALAANGVLGQTYVIYTSDNGFHMGEHRMVAGKNTPYEEDIRVPMVMRGPGVPGGGAHRRAGAQQRSGADLGRDRRDRDPGLRRRPLVAAAARRSGQPWRQSFLIERRQLEGQYLELAEQQGVTRDRLDRHAQVEGMRTAEWSYVEYGDGERELYDIVNDPYQLTNLIGNANPSLAAALAARLGELRPLHRRPVPRDRGPAARRRQRPPGGAATVMAPLPSRPGTRRRPAPDRILDRTTERSMSSDRILGAARWSVLAASLALGLFSPPALAAEPGVRPNIVFILSDDEDVASHRFMPKTQALLGDRGATFENFFVTYSFCCPSRATILRGQYPHNTRIEGIQLPTGGLKKWHALGLQNFRI